MFLLCCEKCSKQWKSEIEDTLCKCGGISFVLSQIETKAKPKKKTKLKEKIIKNKKIDKKDSKKVEKPKKEQKISRVEKVKNVTKDASIFIKSRFNKDRMKLILKRQLQKRRLMRG